ncbi:MAG: amidohydrolase family protein [Actinobacteria bacterium]|nr:amidohydrolase family protein [Actinomycetota bacterium]
MKAVVAERIWRDGSFEPGLAVVVDGTTIADIVPQGSFGTDVEVEDWGRVAIVPGTVNAHGHAFQSLLRGFAADRPFPSWRDEVLYPFSERLDGDAVYTGALFAFAESLLAGATTTVDFFYLNDGDNENAGRVVRAAQEIGIGLVLARTFYDEDAPTSAPKRYREDPVDAAARCRDLHARHAADPLIDVHPAPHSLHAASPETIRMALDLARDLDVPCHLHLAEASYERDQVVERYLTTPVRLLEREGLLDERLVAIHAVWLDEGEMDLLAGHDVGVVHCPGANAFLGDGIAPVPELLRRGVRVALGPDGGCANDRQSVFDEMRMASLAAKARLVDGGALDAPTAFDMGTRAGADLLRQPVGVLEAGRRADLVALDLDDLSLHPLPMLERNVVHSMQATAVKRVMVAGEVVVEDGCLTRIAMDEIRRRVTETTSGWKRP